MPVATNKADLIEITKLEFSKLSALLERVTPEQAMVKEDDTSIKDVVAHRAHWIDLFMGWYGDGQAGREVHMPAKGYKWNQLPEYNALLREQQRELGWQQARAQLKAAHQALLAFLEQSSDASLYGGPMKGAHSKWTAGRWAEAAGASHYRSASKYVRQRLRGFE